MGFAVYKLDLQYNEGAVFGDVLDIRTSFKKQGDYRVCWRQEAWRKNGKKAAVTANIKLVCVSQDKKLGILHLYPKVVNTFFEEAPENRNTDLESVKYF